MIARSVRQAEYGPPELRALDQWVVTKLTPRPGQPLSKPPYVEDGHGGLRLARGPVDSRAHMSYLRASSLVRHGVGGMQWPGFVTLPASDITGGDLDGCRSPRSGRLGLCRPRGGSGLGFSAPALVAYLPTYWSISPSGRGLRFWALGSLADGHGHWSNIGLEMYSQGQYLTETGNRLLVSDRHARPLEGPLSRLFRAAETANRAGAPGAAGRSRLLRLWGSPGTSESDLSFANILSRFTSDPEILELVMRLSGAYRPKWDERRGTGTWLSEEVVAPALGSPPSSPDDAVSKRLVFLRADRDARAALASEVPAPNISWVNARSWLDAGIPPIKWTVEALWMEGGNVTLTAPYKAGKTTALIDLVRCLLSGAPFLGFPVSPVEGRVAYVNAEMMDTQFASWIERLPGLDRVDLLHSRGSNIDLRSPAHIRWMEEQLRGKGYHTLIIDTLAGVYRGDINDNEGMDAFTKALDALKLSTGISNLLLTHHTGRKVHEEGSEHGRGATRLDDWVDARLVIVKKGSDRFLQAEGRGVAEPDIHIEFDEVTRLLSRGAKSRAEARAEASAEKQGLDTQKILAFVGLNPGCRIGDVQAGVQVRKATVARVLDELVRSGRIEDRGNAGQGFGGAHAYFPVDAVIQVGDRVRSVRSRRSATIPPRSGSNAKSDRGALRSPVKRDRTPPDRRSGSW